MLEILLNDLSVHGQFDDLGSFRDALERLMEMRSVARRFRREVRYHSTLLTAIPVHGMRMAEAIGKLPREKQRATMIWLTGPGVCYSSLPPHGTGHRMECKGQPVTDSAVGEAALRIMTGADCGLVSVTPSDWDYSPVNVTRLRKTGGADDTRLQNWRTAQTLEDDLRRIEAPVQCWSDLQTAANSRFGNLRFAPNCFDRLLRVGFSRPAAERFLVLLNILDRMARASGTAGTRTAEGQQLYQDYFTGGDNAWFAPSSQKEINNSRFREALTFPDPDESGKFLLCSWHGKVRSKTLRLHFSWPIPAGKPIYVVYAGPKLTKR